MNTSTILKDTIEPKGFGSQTFRKSFDPRQFQKYRDWDEYVKSQIVPKHKNLEPLDIGKTSRTLFSAMNSTPTVINEPVFEKIFNLQANIPSKEELRSESIEQRNSAIVKLTEGKRKPDLRTINTRDLFQKLDRCLNLSDKLFSPVDADTAVLTLPQNTSGSYPDFIKKGENKDNVLRQLNYVRNTGDTTWINFPAVVRWRTQVRKTGIKKRQFYMFGHLILALENSFLRPFFDNFENDKMTSYCFGNKFPELAKRVKHLKSNYKYIHCFDFKSFDQNASSILIKLAFNYLRTHLRFQNKTQEKLWRALCEYACYCPVASALNGIPYIFQKEDSIMSGSILTNILDTIVHLIMEILFSDEFLKEEISPESCSIMGDDGMSGTNKQIDLKSAAEYFLNRFGAELSIEKSFIYETKPDLRVYFLGYIFDEFGRYADFDLMKEQLIYSEIFIPESVLPTKTRLFSKLASLCFKCVDGYKLWDYASTLVSHELGCKIPETFVEFYSITGEPIDLTKFKSISDYKLNGWIYQ